jgi:phosphoesterase RecJ-like protein
MGVQQPPQSTTALIANHLRSSQKVLLTTHLAPDGDGIGGILALGALLEQLGKEVTLYSSDPVPYYFRFLYGAEKVIDSLPEGASFDATCILDTYSLSLVGPLPPREKLGCLIQIDHHKTRDFAPDMALVDPKSSSVGELVYRISGELGTEVTKEIAKCIYCSIFCDTGSFRYGKTTPEAMRVAADMLEKGVDPWEMTTNIHENHPPSRNRLLGEALRTLTISEDGCCAAIWLTQEMIEQTGATSELTDGFINYARGITGVEVAVQLFEVKPQMYQVSFRSRGKVNVSQIAATFGGGGKKNAAGCRIEGTPETVLQKIFQEAQRLS